MSNQEIWLISLSIGPVQDFISAALRTRDLWFGSHMLSEVSKAAAIAINDYNQQNIHTELIFPAEEESDKLKPVEINVANRIVAQVSGDEDTVKDVINTGKNAARKWLLEEFIQKAKKEAERIINRDKKPDEQKITLRDEIWEIQAKPEDLLELYGTAARINGTYPEAWQRLSQLNSARKNSRDFRQSAQAPNEAGLYGLPKSSLDGRRETVLPEGLDKKIRRKLRMGEGEQLDVLGLVKRLAGGDPNDEKNSGRSSLQFTPTTRIAIDPWIRKIKEAENGLADLEKIQDKLESREYEKILLDTGLMTKVQGNQGIYGDMPFDAGLLYRSVLDAVIAKVKHDKEFPQRSSVQRILSELRKSEVLKKAWKEYRQPCPYYALLLADGDHMGRLIKAAQDKGHHKEISQCLSAFAQFVPKIARDYCAHCIYAGGDDVLLMAPLDTVLLLADELRKAFTTTLEGIAGELEKDAPTFSVGIVIAHMQAPVGRVRKLVHRAEDLAKGSDTDDPRNALAIIVAPRSGADMSFRAKWEREPSKKQDDIEQNEQRSPVEELHDLADLYRDEDLPAGFGYELRETARLVKGMSDEEAKKIAKLELDRILKRKNQGGGGEKIKKNNHKGSPCPCRAEKF
ncbi:type III-B CRISPR-associated protein Cas10/Cmr2 [Candidatus Electrothrix sp.]|uniref:type III-B CRISPR-associated protein Cas10/Cmr2 n=1 Tax=Candidatus Electrothrix sp. TaxID=2170559 RepID=UPI0040569969